MPPRLYFPNTVKGLQQIILPSGIRGLDKWDRLKIANMAPNPNMLGRDWDRLFYSAIKSGDLDSLQKLKNLHYLSKFPRTVVRDGNFPIPLYLGAPIAGYTILDSSKGFIKTAGYDSYADMVKENNRSFLASDVNMAIPYCFSGKSTIPHGNMPHYNFLQRIGLQDKPLIHPEDAIPKVLRLDQMRNWNTFLNEDFNNGKSYKGTPMVYPLYANITNPRIVNFFGRPWRSFGSTEGAANKAFEQFRSGTIIKNVKDWGGTGDEYVIFDPQQVKLTYPILFDSKGEIIPLSRRDDPRNPDMRYYNGGKLKNPTR